MTQVFCLDCDHALNIKNAKIGQKVTCSNCGSEMEVIGINPVELDWVYEPIDDDEDFDDYDDDDE